MSAHYNRARLAGAFREVGLRPGDVVFSHSNVGFFGFPEEGRTPEAVFDTILGAFRDVIGDEGTLAVPTFTYSACKGQPFDPLHTPSTCGMFTEMLRRQPGAVRSDDPIFSVAAIGPKAEALTRAAPEDCFDENSFWGRLLRKDGVICNLNVDAGSTFVHYVEKQLRVPYRLEKRFAGALVRDHRLSPVAAVHFCRDLADPAMETSYELFDAIARARNVAKTAPVGRGAVVAIRARDTYDLIAEEIRRCPDLLIAAGKRAAC